ncbi:MAG: hypothetical protein WCK70_18875, partial [Chloroflexales bacterium]
LRASRSLKGAGYHIYNCSTKSLLFGSASCTSRIAHLLSLSLAPQRHRPDPSPIVSLHLSHRARCIRLPAGACHAGGPAARVEIADERRRCAPCARPLPAWH